MATIFTNNDLRVLSGPFDFQWVDVRPAGAFQYNAPNVYITGVPADYASLAGGEQFVLSRGSTAQSGVTVTVSVPGGGPGTKTLAEVVTDINAVFGVAAGKPTEYAYAWAGAIRLVDATVGLNIGHAEVADYVGATDADKDLLYSRVGLPAQLARDVGQVAVAYRACGIVPWDDQSCVSDNYFPLTGEMRALYIEAQGGGNGVGYPSPIFSLAFALGSTPDKPQPYLGAYQGVGSDAAPTPDYGFVNRVQPAGLFNIPTGVSDIFFRSGGPHSPPQFQSRVGFRVDIPRTAPDRVRCIGLGSLQPTPTSTGRIGGVIAVRVWGLG